MHSEPVTGVAMPTNVKDLFIIIFLSGSVFLPFHHSYGSDLLLNGPDGTIPGGELFDPANAAKAVTSPAKSVSATGGNTAAQAVSAAAQAGVMYRLLLAQGVMDYLHRKQLDKANQKMAEKMEKLEKELRAGKLNPAQFAAIKAAVEDAYQRNAQSGSTREQLSNSDFQNPDLQPNSEGAKFESLGSLPDLSLQNEPNTVGARLDSDLATLSATTNEPLENLNRGPTNREVAPTGSSGTLPQAQTQVPLVISNGISMGLSASHFSPDREQILIKESRTENQNKNQEGIPDNLNPVMGFDGESIDDFFMVQEKESNQSQDQLLAWGPPKSKFSSLAELSGGLAKLFKPLKIQKSPFSLNPYSEEEGIHWGFLILGLGLAYGWGRKRSQPKDQIPHIIPEVVLTPDRSKNRIPRDRRQLNRG